MRLGIGLAFLAALCACNPGSKVMEGRNTASETASTAASDQAVDTAVIETAESSEVALEPVSVGGAFLTCSYKSGQDQGSASYPMDCAIEPVNEVSSVITQADFFKLDTKGTRTPLAVVAENFADLKWTLIESVATVSYNRVEVVLAADNASPVSLTTTLKAALVLKPVTSFWLAGEPNNLLVNNPDGEDCVEFGNLAARNDHQVRTGLASGPYARMNDIGCAQRTSSSFLCRLQGGNNGAKWLISSFQGRFGEYAEACPEAYAFGFPMDEKEVAEVSALIDGNRAIQNIWVNMNDRAEEGKFSIIPR